MPNFFEKFPSPFSLGQKRHETGNALDSEDRIKDEFLAIKEAVGGYELVPYPPRMGVIFRVADKPLITGLLSDQRLVDCCALAVFGENGVGLMHISPNTLPEDDFPHASRFSVYHQNVDVQYLAMLEKLSDLKGGIIVVGDVDLALVLQGFVKGGPNYWGEKMLDSSSRLEGVQTLKEF